VPVTSFLDGAGTQIGDFVRVSRNERVEGLPSIEDGYRAQLVLDAVARSLDTRETVYVRR
jgi:hypothetical protein